MQLEATEVPWYTMGYLGYSVWLNIELGRFDHDLATTEPWESLFFIGKSSPFLALIQVSELYSNLPNVGKSPVPMKYQWLVLCNMVIF